MCLFYSFISMCVCVCVCVCAGGVVMCEITEHCLLSNLWLNLSDRCGLAGTDLLRYEDKSSAVLNEEGNYSH